MDFSSKEFWIGILIFLVIIVIIDGRRRLRAKKYETLQTSKRKQPIFDDDDDEELDALRSEFPSGGPRVVKQRDESELEQITQIIREVADAKKPKLSIPIRTKPEQTSLEFEEPTPVLMDPVEEEDLSPAKVAEKEEKTVRLDTAKADRLPQTDELLSPKRAKKREPEPTVSTERPPQKASAEPPEVVVLHLMCPGDHFQGADVLHAAVENGFRYGAMKIFHYHAEDDGTGPILFSMANSVNPGVFDLANMDNFSTPGLTLFLTLNDNEDPLRAFDTMIEVLDALAVALNGQKQDDTRSTLTKQTVQHYRQRVKESALRRR